MIKNPAISVVVCTHNRAAMLGQAVESLLPRPWTAVSLKSSL